jgi:hypothetical protein
MLMLGSLQGLGAGMEEACLVGGEERVCAAAKLTWVDAV